MTTSLTLPIGPLPHIALDYARLRDEGVRLLGQLASTQWTDFNTHDPGITILEQLCYAITDLGYRTSYPVPDLLSGGDPALPAPEAILTTDPVTRADLRKVALDVDGIGNAWVEDAAPGPAVFHEAAGGELRLHTDPGDTAVPVQLRGIHRVVLQTTERLPGETARVQVAARLHAGRALGSDFEIALVQNYPIGMTATLEVDSVEDPVALMADVLDAIEGYLAPRAQFRPIAEARAQGRTLDDALDGPLLAHGEIEQLPEQRRTVYLSDLLHAILDVPRVKAVRSLILGSSPAAEQWALDIPAGSLPTLDPRATTITLLRSDLPLRVTVTDGRHRLDDRRAPTAAAAAADAAPPPAPPRDLIRHRSIQYQLPAAYGVGALGLASSETPERRAQARQLAGYLLIFDQLFANALAQLAHARDLLSPGDGTRTYFALPVEDARLGLDTLIRDPAGHRAWLDDHVETGDPRDRRKRFLAHLLARYAEELGDHARIAPQGAADPDDLLIADRSAFLRDYPALSRGRGSGYDLSPDASDAGGFEDRLRHKLGLRDGERLYVVEHVLLRPVPEDVLPAPDEDEREVPLLAGVSEPDPWSLHVSIVIPDPEPPDPLRSFEQLVEQTVLAEAPAHLSVDLQWLGKADGVDDWVAFVTAWKAFRAAYRTYRAKRLAQEPIPPNLHLQVRDARDRIIDLLGFGRSYPLRDLGVPDQIVVTPSSRAKIAIDYSQQDVVYELHDRVTGKPILDAGKPIVVDGIGGPIEIVTPPIDVDTSYRIVAVKRAGADTIDDRREAWLRTGPAPGKTLAVRVMEGVDASLEASIQLPVLDSRIDAPKPTDARIGDWGVRADVQILASQEGVTYTLIANAKDLSDPSKDQVRSAPVVGTSGTITLRSAAIPEDVDLRIRGQRTTGTGGSAVTRTAVLDVVLPLRVRPNPTVSAQLVPPVVAYSGAAQVKLDATQASAQYRVHRGRVRDGDFVFDAAPAVPTIDIAGDGRTVRVRRPAKPSPWRDLPGFAPAGDATPGTGGTLNLAIGAPGTDDAFLVIQATKQHQIGPVGTGSSTLPSSVQLDAALALLVRPDPAPALRLAVTLAGGATTGSVLVSGGQPGVFYELHLDGDPKPIGLAAYVHQRDDQSPQLNKGLEQLRIEVDAVVARDRIDPTASPVTTPPLAPLIDTAHLPAGSVLAVQAHKAMSGLGVPLARRATLDDVPAVTAPAPVASGASANIAIEASRAGERYWLIRNGQPIGDPQTGTGGKVVLPTGPVTQKTTFTVAATRPDDPGIAVERHIDIVVDVT